MSINARIKLLESFHNLNAQEVESYRCEETFTLYMLLHYEVEVAL